MPRVYFDSLAAYYLDPPMATITCSYIDEISIQKRATGSTTEVLCMFDKK